jgi:hypothetical protein
MLPRAPWDQSKILNIIVILKYYEKLYNIHVRSEVFTAVTMKNVTFWDIETQFLPHRKHFTSPLWAQKVNAIYSFVTMIY